MHLFFIFIYSLSAIAYAGDNDSKKDTLFHTHDSSRVIYKNEGTVNESGVTVNNFYGLTQLRQQLGPRKGLVVEGTEIDNVSRDSLFELRIMPLEIRKLHEDRIKGLYKTALVTGDWSLIESEVERKDPFAQIYWCDLTLTTRGKSTKAKGFFERGKRFFEIGDERKSIERSGVFSFLSGILSEYMRGKDVAISHYIEASDTFKDDDAQFRFAEILYENEDFEDSLKYYEASANQRNERAKQKLNHIANTDMNPKVDRFRLSVALCAEKEEEYTEAMKLYKLCVRKPFVEPLVESSMRATYRLAKIHERHNRFQKASENYYDIISCRYPVTTVFDIYSGTNQNALDDLNRLCGIRNGYALFYKGKTYGELGHVPELEVALDFYRQANEVEQKPSESDLKYYTARVYRKLGRIAEATQLYFNLAINGDQLALADMDELCRKEIGFALFYRAKVYVHNAESSEASGDLKSANTSLGEALGLFYKASQREPLVAVEAANRQSQAGERKDKIVLRLEAQSESKKALKNRYDKSTNADISNAREISDSVNYG